MQRECGICLKGMFPDRFPRLLLVNYTFIYIFYCIESIIAGGDLFIKRNKNSTYNNARIKVREYIHIQEKTLI